MQIRDRGSLVKCVRRFGRRWYRLLLGGNPESKVRCDSVGLTEKIIGTIIVETDARVRSNLRDV